MDVAFVVYAAYIPLLLILYLLELVVIFMHRNSKFASSFYRVFGTLAVVNIIACLVSSFVFRLPLMPLVNGFYGGLTKETSVWLAAAYVSAYYLNCVSEFLGVCLAMNRFTTLHWHRLHEKFWRSALIVAICSCLLISIAPVWFLFDSKPRFVRQNGNASFVMAEFSNHQGTSVWLNMHIVTVVCNATSTLLYIACLVRLCLFTVTRNYAAERNFFLVGVSSMLGSLPYMAAMMVFYLNLSVAGATVNFELMRFIAFQLPWLLDLKYLAPAPMLLITNKSIRRAIAAILCMNNT